MHQSAKYAAVSSVFAAVACGVVALGFSIAGHTFAGSAQQAETKVSAAARSTPDEPVKLTSALLGSEPVALADKPGTKRGGDWVKVVDAVNMRAGPSSSNPVMKVQLTGAKLRVASRQDGWVKVVEPDTGKKGWVYGKYVTAIEPISRRAEIEETAIR